MVPFIPNFKPQRVKEWAKREREKEIFLLLSSCLLFVPIPRSLISWVAPLSSSPWLSAQPAQSLGISEFPLCSCSWLTYLFNYFTVCLLFKRRGPCCFFPSALLFKTQSFHVGSWLPGPNGCDQHLWSAMTPSKGLVLGALTKAASLTIALNTLRNYHENGPSGGGHNRWRDMESWTLTLECTVE